ncbi:NAD(P)-dependent dehydrogenase, short-chain alcohol dehydrogenase family [Lentzea fradiae]|uniref:NAD(P)-dependent dehydrogenase, short-chain alcohol dehydrogenase family n=1 Tax=Lentzea fradiae TaxID=200378 RepID=A0A1G7W6J6_9PSEU|nr:SDR family oxidoreductase [Lentzea fradiae]SDG67602.1 NAD(P)-dependent dehydrogenase, short-chain alcohol dehydrogenase family [Lentzea fradiae]
MTTVITGGSRGIGAATARRLVRDGHRVVIGYRQAADDARRLEDELGVLAVRADTTDEDDVARLFDAAGDDVTGVVNNAGITSPAGPLTDLRTADLRRVVDVNVIGAILVAREAARRMTGGCIVNVSSGAATLGSPGEYVHYAATKAAVDALTVGLAKELAPRGIRVNCVQPGTIRTDIHQLSGLPDRPDRVAGRVPLGRAGEPDEIAGAIAWLLSADASYATGAILRVTGGT